MGHGSTSAISDASSWARCYVVATAIIMKPELRTTERMPLVIESRRPQLQVASAVYTS